MSALCSRADHPGLTKSSHHHDLIYFTRTGDDFIVEDPNTKIRVLVKKDQLLACIEYSSQIRLKNNVSLLPPIPAGYQCVASAFNGEEHPLYQFSQLGKDGKWAYNTKAEPDVSVFYREGLAAMSAEQVRLQRYEAILLEQKIRMEDRTQRFKAASNARSNVHALTSPYQQQGVGTREKKKRRDRRGRGNGVVEGGSTAEAPIPGGYPGSPPIIIVPSTVFAHAQPSYSVTTDPRRRKIGTSDIGEASN